MTKKPRFGGVFLIRSVLGEISPRAKKKNCWVLTQENARFGVEEKALAWILPPAYERQLLPIADIGLTIIEFTNGLSTWAAEQTYFQRYQICYPRYSPPMTERQVCVQLPKPQFTD